MSTQESIQSKKLYKSEGIGMQQLIMQMSEFFIENPHYKLLDYEPIAKGLRFYYVVVQ